MITDMQCRWAGIKSLDIELEVERMGLEAGILIFALSPAEIVFPSNETLSKWTGLSSEYRRSYLVSKLDGVRKRNKSKVCLVLTARESEVYP